MLSDSTYASTYKISIPFEAAGSTNNFVFTVLLFTKGPELHHKSWMTIPKEIGNLKQLESIDHSSNNLWGEIPQSMPGLSFLSALNLSFNNFMGKIPSGTQIQGFTNLSYIGNHQLCGPLTKICSKDENSHNTKPIVEDEEDDDTSAFCSLFYMDLGIGFAVGFWGVLGAILFNRKCRLA
ncbi:hypothetical protein JHK84_056426 [Glycine max]|nr:hypothetical protein JHK86_056386 [Glycine max]KAG5075195.1 hypothetical protein JHK84_056426 [Glycine max]